jgi:uncharacterized membrane protein YciS (DUF1049 family)
VRRLLYWIAVLALFVGTLWLGWSFRSGNTEPFELDLIWITLPNVELWWLVLVSFGTGAFFSAVITGFAWLRGRLLNRRYRKTIQRLESELHQMRSLPLAGSSSSADAISDFQDSKEQA